MCFVVQLVQWECYVVVCVPIIPIPYIHHGFYGFWVDLNMRGRDFAGF